MTISSNTMDRYTEEREFYKRMGWACCPECDNIFYDWEELKRHIDCCVYGDSEQGINPSNKQFTWSIK